MNRNPATQQKGTMPIIDACHTCGTPVYHDGTEFQFPHQVLCEKHRNPTVLKLILVFRPEACADPMGAHAFSPFDGIEILAKLPEHQVDSYVDRKKLHNPTWSFHIEDDADLEA
jgi:hypothetical protein